MPTAYLIWALVSEQNIAVDFATQEVSGTAYLHAIADVQSTAAMQAIGHGEPGDLAGRLADIETHFGASLQTSAMAGNTVEKLRNPARLDAARASLRTLIVRIGDQSNLILDNQLIT